MSNSTLKALMPILLAWVVASTVLARPVVQDSQYSKSSSLMARLKLDEPGPGSANCWDSLFQLQSCTGEVLLFFLNGETYLGAGCCNAIRVIQHHCWPTMLGSLGFTADEGDILRDYCDDAATSTVSATPPPVKS